MIMYVSFLVNLEDSDLIGVFPTLTSAVKETFIYLVKNEYLEDEDIEYSDDEFLDILKHETNGWMLLKMHEICKKYNSAYDNEHFFVSIKATDINTQKEKEE